MTSPTPLHEHQLPHFSTESTEIAPSQLKETDTWTRCLSSKDQDTRHPYKTSCHNPGGFSFLWRNSPSKTPRQVRRAYSMSGFQYHKQEWTPYTHSNELHRSRNIYVTPQHLKPGWWGRKHPWHQLGTELLQELFPNNLLQWFETWCLWVGCYQAIVFKTADTRSITILSSQKKRDNPQISNNEPQNFPLIAEASCYQDSNHMLWHIL